MAKKTPPDLESQVSESERWSFSRPIGLARALMKAGYGTRKQTAEMVAREKRLVSDFFPRDVPGLQTAGRLDSRTTGLLLISNDRPWNNLVTGSSLLEQEFRFQVEGELTELEIGVMTAGVHLPTLGLFRPLSVKVVEVLNGRTVVNMVVQEGKVRQVRRMLSTLRHKVVVVRRTRIGAIRLGDLPVGGIRHLTSGEVRHILDAGKTESPTTPG